MATFSINQVRQLYVANKSESSVTSASTVGTLHVGGDKTKTHMYVSYMGAGGQTRSDLIDIKNIISATATDADKLVYTLKRYKVALDKTVNEGNPIASQDYLLKANIQEYQSPSMLSQAHKYGVVHAYSKMTASDFYKTMALSFVANLRDVRPLLNVYLETGGTLPGTEGSGAVPVKIETKPASLSGTYTGIIVEEAIQPWVLGTMQETHVPFTLFTDAVTFEGDERLWGTINEVKGKTKIDNGHNIADLEYFCMGARGDHYRNIGWPNVIPTTYLVDPKVKYNVIDIHYYTTEGNENPQKSEKTITIVVPKIGDGNSESNVLANSVITEINTASGLNIAKLSLV